MNADREQADMLHHMTTLRRLLFPDMCLGCAVHVSAQGTVCPECWADLVFIDRPYCEITGRPFAHDFGQGAVSAEAIANPPRYARARAATIHDGLARRLVTRLKYGDRTNLAPWMAQWMVRAGKELLCEADCIVPVPLHRMRYWTRRFNQSAELARHISGQCAKPHAPDALIRAKSTRPQVGLTARARQDNVSGAFIVPDTAFSTISGRHIVLIDDVLTTGATIDAACRALIKAKAAKIDVLTFSRVVNHL